MFAMIRGDDAPALIDAARELALVLYLSSE